MHTQLIRVWELSTGLPKTEYSFPWVSEEVEGFLLLEAAPGAATRKIYLAIDTLPGLQSVDIPVVPMGP